MRILVDLYHQSQRFITKENLSQAIDHAFVYRHPDNSSTLQPESPFNALEIEIAYRRRAPKFAPPNNTRPISKKEDAEVRSRDWSLQRGPREAAVMSALYGVTDGQGQPQYDALVDSYQKVKEEIEKEKAQSKDEAA